MQKFVGHHRVSMYFKNKEKGKVMVGNNMVVAIGTEIDSI